MINYSTARKAKDGGASRKSTERHKPNSKKLSDLIHPQSSFTSYKGDEENHDAMCTDSEAVRSH